MIRPGSNKIPQNSATTLVSPPQDSFQAQSLYAERAAPGGSSGGNNDKQINNTQQKTIIWRQWITNKQTDSKLSKAFGGNYNKQNTVKSTIIWRQWITNKQTMTGTRKVKSSWVQQKTNKMSLKSDFQTCSPRFWRVSSISDFPLPVVPLICIGVKQKNETPRTDVFKQKNHSI